MKLYDKPFFHRRHIWNCMIRVFLLWTSTRALLVLVNYPPYAFIIFCSINLLFFRFLEKIDVCARQIFQQWQQLLHWPKFFSWFFLQNRYNFFVHEFFVTKKTFDNFISFLSFSFISYQMFVMDFYTFTASERQFYPKMKFIFWFFKSAAAEAFNWPIGIVGSLKANLRVI